MECSTLKLQQEIPVLLERAHDYTIQPMIPICLSWATDR